ncbi:myelin transcription factor 1-like protein [Brienomyrus brachyistius]|uniref:myelin transcription factor 1-like protein n=1 Tax=Brienomyrus brachyistius TaxID=42636 RepID=UPI0020B3FEA1|nr:myelin transcription factor 1-like protein [Brienomyrus brachyistius]XP_048825933.1 myelin transcription factor 1-like protein [Brienomyrus brachyistius]
MNDSKHPTFTVIFLIFLLVILIVALIYLYKKLNREADGKYTVHELIYGEDGARQRLQSGVQALENFLGIQIWPRKREDADGEDVEEQREEHQEDRVEVPDIEKCQEHDAKSLDEKAEEDSDDYSSMEGVDLQERAKLKENKEEGEKEEEEGEGGGTASGVGGGLLVDLKQFSGSVIWQEEAKTEVTVDSCDMTAL